MDSPNCLVFPDRDDWIVFAPVSQLAMRANARVAEQFRTFVDRGRPGDCKVGGNGSGQTGEFRPTCVAIYANNQCLQKCIYCYGFPSRRSRSQLDLQFCRAAMDLVAQNVSELNSVLDVYFTGTGEPTFNWPLFTNCMQIILEVKRLRSIPTHLTLCTGGQVDTAKADWIAEHFDEVNISLDGPSDIQNRQRPRTDGHDSLPGPVQLARTVLRHGRKLQLKCTVTRSSVKRMPEIVEFVAREIGPVQLEFEMMFALPWNSSSGAESPYVREFVEEFGRALETGSRLNVGVLHQAVNLGKLGRDPCEASWDYLCLAAPNIITAFHDLPQELDFDPGLGAYGWYDRATDRIQFDHEKRRRLHQNQDMTGCRACPCYVMCSGQGAVKSRLMGNTAALEPICEVRIGILQQLLRRAVPRQTKTEEQLL